MGRGITRRRIEGPTGGDRFVNDDGVLWDRAGQDRADDRWRQGNPRPALARWTRARSESVPRAARLSPRTAGSAPLQHRDPRFPQVPTVEEAGLKGFDVTWWQGIFAPAGTPPAVLEKLSRAARKTAEDPLVKTTMFDAGFVPEFIPPAELITRVQIDMVKFRKIATDAGLDLE